MASTMLSCPIAGQLLIKSIRGYIEDIIEYRCVTLELRPREKIMRKCFRVDAELENIFTGLNECC